MNEVTARIFPRLERVSAATVTAKGVKLEPLPYDAGTGPLPTAIGADALVVPVDPEDEAAMAAVMARAQIPQAPPVIAVVTGLNVDITRRLLRAGVADVMPAPLLLQELEAAMGQLQVTPHSGRGSDGGQVIAFFGSGGSGATSLAVQAGIELARTVRTCIIDMDVQRGAVALQLDLKPSLSLLDIINAGERLDSEVLQSVAAEHSSGLWVVSCPPEILPLEDVTPATVDRLIAVARRQFALVILDLPPEWTDWKIRAVDRADLALLVAPPSVFGVHQCRRMIPLLEANRIIDQVQFVANRVQRAMFRKADLSQQETVLGRAYAYRVADDPEGMTMANEQGKPLADVRSGSRVLKDVKALAAGIAERVHVQGVAAS